ncbi:MAG: hypothetical protein KIT83_05600 [Bryobacterales bacterium]|nr:hypothetical protein [Bryobacterales bacterium]
MNGMSAIPRRGLEVGGLLLGTWESPGPAESGVSYPALVACITQCFPVEIAHEAGPRFQVNENDEEALRTLIDELRKSGETVLGWWRSHIVDEDLSLASEDLALTSRVFGAEPALVLLVLPRIGDVATATLHRVVANEYRSSLAFPLVGNTESPALPGRADQLAAHSPNAVTTPVAVPALKPALDPVPVPPVEKNSASAGSTRVDDTHPATLSRSHSPSPQPNGETSSHEWAKPAGERARSKPSVAERFPAWGHLASRFRSQASTRLGRYQFLVAGVAGALGVVVLLFLVTGGWPIGQKTRSQQSGLSTNASIDSAMELSETDATIDGIGQSETPGSLGLKARQADGALHVEWDRTLPPVQQASGGLLLIEDGPLRKEIALTPADLKAGSVIWFPQSESVRAGLTLNSDPARGDSQRLHASIQVFGLAPTALPRESARVEPAEARRTEDASGPSRQALSSSSRPLASPRPSAISTSGNADTRAAGSVPAERSETASQTSGWSAPDDPGRITGRPSPVEDPADALRAGLTEASGHDRPQCRATLATISYKEKRSPFGVFSVLRKLPLVPGKDNATKGNFRAAQTTSAACPDLSNARLSTKPEWVDIIAEIDKGGMVQQAKLAESSAATEVGEKTMESVQAWRFDPATVAEKPVETEVRLRVYWRYPTSSSTAVANTQ